MHKMKGYSIQSLVPLGIVFVVVAFVLSIGAQINNNFQKTICDGTWYETGVVNVSVTTVPINPVTGGSYGCCASVNTSGDSCVTWETTKASLNTSVDGTNAIVELGSWLPTLALVVIAAIVIGVLITYLARGDRA